MTHMAYLFTCVLVRLTPLTLLWPGVGGRLIPLRVRAGVTLISAAWITSLHLVPTSVVPDQVCEWGSRWAYELFLGLGLALGVLVLLSGLQLAGSLISQLAGLSLNELGDPTGLATGSAIDRFFTLLTLAALLAMGGHRRIVAALLTCFQLVPPGSPPPRTDVAPLLAELLTRSFQLGFRAAAPVGFSLLLATVVMGLLARTIPQLNSIGLGLSMNLILLLAVSCLTVGSVTWMFEQHVADGLQILTKALTGTLPSDS